MMLKREKIAKFNLPNLIIMGGMKCGTTSLHYYLDLHPQISMSLEKELDFFIGEKNWNRGIEWYKSHFTGSVKVHGESSPNYTRYPKWSGVPERMYSVVPDAKLIYILRDPIKRIISHYIHSYAKGRENRTINEALADFENNSYVDGSKYYMQLSQYLNYFPDSSILVITLDELSTVPHATLKKVFRHLDVDENIYFKNRFKPFHTSKKKRRKNSWGERLEKMPIIKKIEKLPPQMRWHINQLIYLPFSYKIEKPILDEYLQNKLADYLREDINLLRKYTGKDFNNWCV